MNIVQPDYDRKQIGFVVLDGLSRQIFFFESITENFVEDLLTEIAFDDTIPRPTRILKVYNDGSIEE